MIYDRYQLIDSAFRNLFEGLDKFEDDGYFDLEAEPKLVTLDADVEDKEVIEGCSTKRRDKSKKDLEEAEDLSVVTKPKKEKKVDKDWAKFYRSKRAAKVESKDSCLTEGSKKVKARIKRASTKRALTEASDKVFLEVVYESYDGYGEGGITKALVTGTDERDALKCMTDHMSVNLTPDIIEEDDLTVDEIIDKLDRSNGDGSDLIRSLVNLNTGKILILIGDGYHQEFWHSKKDFIESYRVKARIKRASTRETLTEASDKVTLEVIYEPYDRYGGGGGIKKALIKGTDERDALKCMTDHMALNLKSYFMDDMTVDEIIDDLDSSNGDGCDFIMNLVNLNTGKTLITVDGGYDEEIWDDSEDFDESYRVKAKIKKKGLKESCNTRKFLRRK